MIIVVGGGPAGRMAAIALASAGKEVTIIEKRALGGQCVFDGCMLVCAFNDVARVIENARHMRELGIISCEVSVDYPMLLEKLEATQKKLARILDMETVAAGVKVEYGVVAEVKPDVFDVNESQGMNESQSTSGKVCVFVDGKKREAEAIIIATGGQPNIPDIVGNNLQGTYNPRTLRMMKTLPKRLVIIGGGITAAEFAYIYAAFGCEVTVIARSTLLSMLPPQLLKDAKRDLKRVKILEHATPERVLGSTHVEGVVVDGNTIPCDAVLFATGVDPVSPFVSGVLKRDDGAIIVDEDMQTSVTGVYAAGDVIGNPCFTPVSRLQGFVAAGAILGVPRSADLDKIPFCVVLGMDYTVCKSVKASESNTNESIIVESSPNIAGPGSYWHVLDGTVGHMQLETSADGNILGFATSGPSTSIVGTYLGYLVRKGINVNEFDSMLEVHPNSDGMYSLIRFAE